jgi:hypothetical protein
MQPSAIRDRVYYPCEYKEQEAALHPGLDHPRTINLREDITAGHSTHGSPAPSPPRAAHRHHHRTQPGQRRGKRRHSPRPPSRLKPAR